MSQLSNLLQNKRARREMLEARLDPIVEQLKSLGAVKIVLFGSLARQEVDVDSDLDLLVIMPPIRAGKNGWAFCTKNSKEESLRILSPTIRRSSKQSCRRAPS